MGQFVEFKQALNLKQLGFVEKCDYVYHGHQGLLCGPVNMKETINPNLFAGMADVCAPTISQVLKWFFEEHNYFISVQYNEEIKKFQCIIHKRTFTDGYPTYIKQNFKDEDELINYTLERCLEKAINKVLELIKEDIGSFQPLY